MSLTNEEIFEFDAEPVRRLPHSSDGDAFVRRRKEDIALRDKEHLHSGSPRPPTLLMPLYNATLKAQVWMRPRPRPGGCDMLFLAILEPMEKEDLEAVYRRFDLDLTKRKEVDKKKGTNDTFGWQPYQVRKQAPEEEKSPALYRTDWDFANPMKSLETLFRAVERGVELERKLKQLAEGVYVYVPTSSTPRRATTPR